MNANILPSSIETWFINNLTPFNCNQNVSSMLLNKTYICKNADF